MTPETTTSTTATAASSTTPANVFLYAGDQIIENVTKGHFYYQDSLGNTSHVSDAVGNLLERYTYSAFGIPTFYTAAGAWRTTSAYGIRHLFQGQLWTQETGLNDYRNRTELPTMGVFLQPDPIGFKGDALNLYRFVNNNAVNRIDPLGLIDNSPEGRLTSMGRGDWDWFNGEVADEMRRQQEEQRDRGNLTMALSPKDEGPKSSKTNNANTPAYITREADSYPEYVRDKTGKIVLWKAHTDWTLRLWDKNGKQLGSGIRVDEKIERSNAVSLQATGEKRGGFWTKPNGAVTDRWTLPFTSANGQVTTTQTIFIRWQTVIEPCHRRKKVECARQLLGVQGLAAWAGASSHLFVRTFQHMGPPSIQCCPGQRQADRTRSLERSAELSLPMSEGERKPVENRD